MFIRDPVERFWSYVDRSAGPEKCWPWAGALEGSGYGSFGVQKLKATKRAMTMKSHRLAWELTNSLIPEGIQVLHSCDNRPCCNPSHLFLGTNDDNVADKMAKGRHYSGGGDSHKSSKLRSPQVLEIRTLYFTGGIAQLDLAHRYGVSKSQIGRLVRREAWRHI